MNRQASVNTKWREIEALLKKLGATKQEGAGSRVAFTLDDHKVVMHKPHGKAGVDKGRLKTVADFLKQVGVKVD